MQLIHAGANIFPTDFLTPLMISSLKRAGTNIPPHHYVYVTCDILPTYHRRFELQRPGAMHSERKVPAS